MTKRRLLPAVLAIVALAPCAWAEPQFTAPIACEIGKTCFVQHYVDMDPSTEARDYTCGTLTYDGHKGTDIRLPNYVAMDRGVAVLAAAAGTVLRIRDGMDDISVRETGAAAIRNREAGNGVIVDHGNGWVTQYAHLKKGSVVVRPGQHVEAGDKLGEVGLSGDTEFPHLHFEVRHDDQPVDPFTDETIGSGCGVAGHPLWRPELAQEMAYRPSGLLGDGFAPGRPDAEAARHGAYAAPVLVADSPALVFWIDVFGLQAGDHVLADLTAPDGRKLVQSDQPLDRSKDQYFAFVGKARPQNGWPTGTYRGAFRILRAGKTALEGSAEITLQ